MDSAPARRLGEVVGGKYRLIRFLASGGMGLVFEARHEVLGRSFAVKLLRPELAVRRDALGRFHREALAAGALECEHVVSTVDFGLAEDGTPFIVMEYLRGESLGALLAHFGRLPLGRAADLVVQACVGIQAAHDAGILHRDLKPANLLVSRRADGTDWLKVLDFGIAKLREETGEQVITQSGIVPGTPAYMSPEQARGERLDDPRTDVYALGVLLYESLAGQVPHPGESREAVLHHVATQSAVPLASLCPDLPVRLREVIERCLSVQASERPATAAELAGELAPFVTREVWPQTAVAAEAAQAAEPAEAAEHAVNPAGASTLASPEERSRTPAVSEQARRPGHAGHAAHAVRAAHAAHPRDGGPAPPHSASARKRLRPVAALGLGFLVVGAAGGGVAWRSASRAPVVERSWDPSLRFFVPVAPASAVQQIAALEREGDRRRAALLTALEAVPRAIWRLDGTPVEVERTTRALVARASREDTVPLFVTYNLPYRDCAQYSAGGALDVASFLAWIEGFARGVGSARAVILLEPDSLGIIPYHQALDGTQEWCRPSVTDDQGKPVAAPEANPDVRFAALSEALARMRRLAPRASVYLDGTHAGWLSVGDAAYRLSRAGVRRAQGFFLNVANQQGTARSVQYGTFIAQCLARADGERTRPENTRREEFASCATPSQFGDAHTDQAWSAAAAWYETNEALPARPDRAARRLVHFVIDTSRNGRPLLPATRFSEPPFSQPPSVVKALEAANWCNPRGLGAGVRPTANTGFPLVDAFIWAKPPGESDGSCDVAGGARAWDYARYNPWGLSEEAQRHFDPLWAMVDPAVGDWFPEQALELAENADPHWGTAGDRSVEAPAVILPAPAQK